MTRDDLKSLIRECLIEIISEGSASPRPQMRGLPPQAPVREAPPRMQMQEAPRRKTIGGMSLDRPAMPRQETQVQKTNSMVSKLTSDPVLSSIFADTAATTLQEQVSAEKMRPGTAADPISVATAGREVHELFGDAANNWASIAFGEVPSR